MGLKCDYLIKMFEDIDRKANEQKKITDWM